MKKIDFEKIHRVAELSREADFCIKMQDYGQAKEIAEEIAKLGWPVMSSDIYIRTGDIQKARELVIPVAEELCERGFHLREAVYYKNVGMIENYLLALQEHRLVYETRFRKKPMN